MDERRLNRIAKMVLKAERWSDVPDYEDEDDHPAKRSICAERQCFTVDGRSLLEYVQSSPLYGEIPERDRERLEAAGDMTFLLEYDIWLAGPHYGWDYFHDAYLEIDIISCRDAVEFLSVYCDQGLSEEASETIYRILEGKALVPVTPRENGLKKLEFKRNDVDFEFDNELCMREFFKDIEVGSWADL